MLCPRNNSIYSVSSNLLLLGPANLYEFYRSRTKRSIGMNDTQMSTIFSQVRRTTFSLRSTRRCYTHLSHFSSRILYYPCSLSRENTLYSSHEPSTGIDVPECFLFRSINPRTGASGMTGIRTSRSGRDRPLLDQTKSDTKIARSSFHCRNTSSVPLSPRRERPWNYSGDTPSHPDQPIANAALAPKSRPGAL